MSEKTDTWQSLMDSAYNEWQSKKIPRKNWLNSIDELHKEAVLLGNLNYQVCNGGFYQWVSNGYGLEVNEVMSLLNTIYNEHGIDLCRQVYDMVNEIEPFIDTDKECEGCSGYYLVGDYDDNDDTEEEFGNICDIMDDKFYEINERFEEVIEAYFQSKVSGIPMKSI